MNNGPWAGRMEDEMKVQIKSRYDGSVLREVDGSLRGANLRGADLRGANLRGANLRGADLYGANLYGADLGGADLYGADLRGANLRGANLRGANLRGANLYGADLRGANLRGADLYGANLYGADLRGADLYGADLGGADLRGADLGGANLYGACLGDPSKPETKVKGLASFKVCPETGAFRAYKKLGNGTIAELSIPAKAKRVNAYGSRKCRASEATVIKGAGPSGYDPSFTYKKGKTVKPKAPFCDDPRIECASGIHFFMTREEAEDYQ